MSRHWLLFLLILVLTFLAQLVLDWWSAALVPLLLGAALGRHGGRAFLAGAAGVGQGWLLAASWSELRTDGLLTHRVAQLLPLGGHDWLVVLITTVLGALVGGLAALSGCWLRLAVRPEKGYEGESV
jgi:hypothetical protein